MPQPRENRKSATGQQENGVLDQSSLAKQAVKPKKNVRKPWTAQTLSWRPGQYLPKRAVRTKEQTVEVGLQAPSTLSSNIDIGLNGVDYDYPADFQEHIAQAALIPVDDSLRELLSMKYEARQSSEDDLPSQYAPLARRNRASQDVYAAAVPQTSSSSPQYALNPTLLDTIATRLTYTEKTTLWNYFHFVPAAAYGTTGTGPFCAFRDISLPSCQRYPQALTWMLIAAERHHAIRTRTPHPVPSMLHRKASAYKAIGHILADETARYTDEALVVIIGAIVIESRFLDVEVTRMHMKGLETLIAQRGGLASLFVSSAVMGHPLFYVGYLTSVPLAVDGGREEIEQLKGRFMKELGEMRRWNRAFRGLVEESQVVGRRRYAVENSGLTAYIATRCRVFGSLALKHHLTPPQSNTETYHARTSRFISLYLLNLILSRYNPILPASSTIHDDYIHHSMLYSSTFHSATTFLLTLAHSLAHSWTLNPLLEYPSIRLEILPWIIAKAWVDSDPFFAASQRGGEEELALTEIGVRAVKVWGGLGEVERIDLGNEVRWWLCGSAGEGDREGIVDLRTV